MKLNNENSQITETCNQERNIIAYILRILSYLGIIFSIIPLGDGLINSKFPDAAIGLSLLIGSILILGFSEVIKLLDKICENTKK